MFNKIILSIIKAYQIIFSPDKGVFKTCRPVCRFWPTCSDYGLQAIGKYGVLKGGLLATKRIFKCHPFSNGGYDPVK